jgi:hypothetical protein
LQWHDLRHEAISRLSELTGGATAKSHRPSDAAMLARYTHLRADRLRGFTGTPLDRRCRAARWHGLARTTRVRFALYRCNHLTEAGFSR